jgi:TolB protein
LGFFCSGRIRLVALGVVVLALLAALPAGAKVRGPNGRIVFSRFDQTVGDTVTYTANPDGTRVQPLFPGIHTGAAHWSPDGTRLALQAGLNNPCPPCAASTIILSPDTGSYRVLSPPEPNLATNCSIWSPDAKRLACEVGSMNGSRNGIYTIRASDGRGLTQVTSNPGGDDVPIDYSPSGKQLVFGRLGQNHECSRHNALYVVNVDGSGLRRITPWGFCDDDGGWSPDGSKIVFEHRGSLYTVHPDGTRLRKISLQIRGEFSAFDAGWSPDGMRIVFALYTRTSNGNVQERIATANADGSNVQQVTISPPGSPDSQPDWGSHALTG